MKSTLTPVVDTECICRNCKKEFVISKEQMLEDYRQCTFCGSLRWDYKDAVIKKSKNNMKVIFLDIDGVLNVIPQGRDKYGAIFHQHFIDNLRTLIEKTDAKIVISSTWRYSGLSVMQEMWKVRNLPGEVIDVTPFKSKFYELNKDLPFDERFDRGYEIFEWLENHPEVTNYVILDDDTDMLPKQLNNFVLTRENFEHTDYIDFGYGLTKECVDKCMDILKAKKNGL